MSDVEDRIRAAKAKRESLVTKKAEKLALLKRAQDDLKALKTEAEELGYDLKDIPSLVEEKKEELNRLVTQLEASLEAAEASMATYE